MTDQWVRYFSVTDPRRHIKGFTVYKVTSTVTFLPHLFAHFLRSRENVDVVKVFPRNCPEAKTEVIVWKRFKEFQKLYKELKNRHEKLYLKDQFPAFCEPQVFGRFDSNVIEERRTSAQTLLDFAAKHSPLFTSQACVKFFEKSYKVVLNEDNSGCSLQQTLTSQVPLPPSSLRDSDAPDNVSVSSSPSTLTDTDSATSIVSSPLHTVKDESWSQSCSMAAGDNSPSSKSLQIRVVSTFKEETANTITQKKENEEEGIRCTSTTCHEASLPPVCHPCRGAQTVVQEESLSPVMTPKAIPPKSENGIIGGEITDVASNTHLKEDLIQSLVMDYITQAGYHISQAVEYESNSQYELAFSSYKAAISCLLGGVEGDTSEDRKAMVQRKASQYLLRAEQIYHNYLDVNHNTTRSIPEVANIHQIPDSIGTRSWKSFEAPVSDLKIYKVLGIVSSVILALNTKNDTPYIIKVLHKSPCPVERRIKSIIPCNVPFMSSLHSFIENERAVFLILEQARGGRLWDHISPYFEIYHSPESSKNAFTDFLTGIAKEDKVDFPSNQQTSAQREVQSSQEKLPLNFSCGGCHDQKYSAPVRESSAQLSPASHAVKDNIQSESQTCVVIPDVIIQEAPTLSDEPNPVCSLGGPDILPLGVDSDIDDILRNSQNLLESVNKTLSISEDATRAVFTADVLGLHEVHQNDEKMKCTSANKKECILPQNVPSKCVTKERTSLISTDHKRQISRERKPSSSRHSRSKMRFSCDDMFEGRARALSRSLDREALQKNDSRVNQSVCLGLPLDTVRLWAAQLLLALDALHKWGVVIGDLRPDNLLLGSGLSLVLTYQCQWVCVDHIIHPEAIEQLYAAPEIGSIQAKTAAADWWSYGAILFELLSGETLHSCHPGGLHCYSTLHIPNVVCEEGASLLRQLLQFEAKSRLGVGPHGVAKLKAHSFFKGVEWHKVLLMSASV